MDNRIPRHWLLIAPRGEGKSTFAAQLSPEYLVADLDGRWAEQHKNAAGKSHIITESDPLKLADEMKKLRPQIGGYVQTIIFDSGTAVMDYLQSKGRLMEAAARERKEKFNLNDLHKLKADTMRVLRFAALQWHCDVCWIFHTETSMESGKEKVRTTISNTELERMKANLNAVLTIVKDKTGMRGIRIEWSRFNNGIAAGQTVWDTQGMWKGVPERLDLFLQSFIGNEGYNGNAYNGDWLMKFLDGKGVKFADMQDMYMKLDIREEPVWFDRAGWTAIIRKALPEPTK
jgi:hypothetical protein